MESALNIIIISGIVYHDDTTVIISKHVLCCCLCSCDGYLVLCGLCCYDENLLVFLI